MAPDESRISHAHTRVSGWVEQLDVNTTGELVRAGQPLARIFSQELLSSQTEYLAARRATAASGIASAVIASGRTRLTVLGMSPEEITEIEQTGEPKRLVTLVAPRSGVVVNRGISVGMVFIFGVLCRSRGHSIAAYAVCQPGIFCSFRRPKAR